LDRFDRMNDLIGVLGIELNQGESKFTGLLFLFTEKSKEGLSPPFSLHPSKADTAVSRLDVLVQMKNIIRVMLSFDLCQPCKV